MLNLTEAPIFYGFGATALALVWGIKLKRLAREQIRSQDLVDLASESP